MNLGNSEVNFTKFKCTRKFAIFLSICKRFFTHHNVVALHLRLLLGEFLQLQFNTVQNKQENAHLSKILVSAGSIQKLWGLRDGIYDII